MANVQQNVSPLAQLASLLGLGDSSGVGSDINTGSTVPTSYNTSNSWQPPNLSGSTNTSGFGMNLGTGQLALGGLSALANLWGSTQSNKLANQQFEFQKEFANTNLNNQIKSYNTALEDRLNARGAVEGRSSDYTADLINQRRLTR